MYSLTKNDILKKIGFYVRGISMGETKTACDTVKEYLFNQIEGKKLTIGSRLPTEKQLTTTLNVSRTSVREALQSLKGLGLVKSIQGSGYEIANDTEGILSDALRAIISLKDIQFSDISNVREALESKAAELAITHGISLEDMEYLQNCIDKIESSLTTNPEKTIEFDMLFHKKIAELSQNEFIKSFILGLSSFSNKYIFISWDKVENHQACNLLQIHKEIIYYLKNNDTKGTINAIKEHYKMTDTIISSNTDFSESESTDIDTLVRRLLSMGYTNDQICSNLYNLIGNENTVL